jgi:predicted NBD/HSP70 family sugar kinase
VSTERVGSLSSLRQLNRLRVLEVVRERGSVSRAEIAGETGLARSTVSTLIGELQRAGLVIEQGEGRPGAAQAGRPPVLLSLDPSAGAVLGIQFNHSYVRVAVADLSLALLAEETRDLDVDHDAASGIDAAATLADEVLARADIDRDRLLGAGVGVAGPIDRAAGAVGSSTILPAWVGVNVAARLTERLETPVHVDNDANLGALAESVLGAGRGVPEMAYVMLSSGIGAGLILGGQLYRGAGGTAGEIGHVLVDESGPMCRCGNRGCLETFVGAGALVELLRRSHGPDLTVDRMIALARDGDPGCQRVLADAGRTVGGAAAVLCNQFNPARIVIGGELAGAGELLLDPLRQAVRRHAIPAAADDVEIVAGELGGRAELLGAVALVVGQSELAYSGRLRAATGR